MDLTLAVFPRAGKLCCGMSLCENNPPVAKKMTKHPIKPKQFWDHDSPMDSELTQYGQSGQRFAASPPSHLLPSAPLPSLPRDEMELKLKQQRQKHGLEIKQTTTSRRYLGALGQPAFEGYLVPGISMMVSVRFGSKEPSQSCSSMKSDGLSNVPGTESN